MSLEVDGACDAQTIQKEQGDSRISSNETPACFLGLSSMYERIIFTYHDLVNDC